MLEGKETSPICQNLVVAAPPLLHVTSLFTRRAVRQWLRDS